MAALGSIRSGRIGEILQQPELQFQHEENNQHVPYVQHQEDIQHEPLAQHEQHFQHEPHLQHEPYSQHELPVRPELLDRHTSEDLLGPQLASLQVSEMQGSQPSASSMHDPQFANPHTGSQHMYEQPGQFQQLTSLPDQGPSLSESGYSGFDASDSQHVAEPPGQSQYFPQLPVSHHTISQPQPGYAGFDALNSQRAHEQPGQDQQLSQLQTPGQEPSESESGYAGADASSSQHTHQYRVEIPQLPQLHLPGQELSEALSGYVEDAPPGQHAQPPPQAPAVAASGMDTSDHRHAHQLPPRAPAAAAAGPDGNARMPSPFAQAAGPAFSVGQEREVWPAQSPMTREESQAVGFT